MTVHITPADDADANAIATALENIRPWPGYQTLARSGGPWVFVLEARDAEALLAALYPEVTARLTIDGRKRTGGVVTVAPTGFGFEEVPPAPAQPVTEAVTEAVTAQAPPAPEPEPEPVKSAPAPEPEPEPEPVAAPAPAKRAPRRR